MKNKLSHRNWNLTSQHMMWSYLPILIHIRSPIFWTLCNQVIPAFNETSYFLSEIIILEALAFDEITAIYRLHSPTLHKIISVVVILSPIEALKMIFKLVTPDYIYFFQFPTYVYPSIRHLLVRYGNAWIFHLLRYLHKCKSDFKKVALIDHFDGRNMGKILTNWPSSVLLPFCELLWESWFCMVVWSKWTCHTPHWLCFNCMSDISVLLLRNNSKRITSITDDICSFQPV